MDNEQIDMVAIEAEARKMRAQAMADLLSGMAASVKALISKIAFPRNLGARKPA